MDCIHLCLNVLGELNVRVSEFDVLQKLDAVFCLLDGKSVIHTPGPQLWWMGDSIDGLCFKLLHEQVGNKGADEGSHYCPIHLFIMPNLKSTMSYK